MALAGLSKSEKDEHCVCFAALALHDGGAEINADSIKAMVEACVEIKILRRVLNCRVDFHAIDATPARWRGDAGSPPHDGTSAATPSPRNDLVKDCRVHPTHSLISTQVEGETQEVPQRKPRIGLGALAKLGGAASRARKAAAKKAREAEEKAKKEAEAAAAKEAAAKKEAEEAAAREAACLLYTSPSPRDQRGSRMPSSA